jgi:L-fuculose-phosphate aldolase
VRSGKTFWITPTGACADTLKPHDLVACHPGRPLSRGRLPGRTASLARVSGAAGGNRRAAQSRSHSVALTFAGQDFRPIDFEGRYYFDSVPVLSLKYAEYPEKAPEELANALAEHRIAMVRGHGVYAWGETLNQAYRWTCSLELSAKIYCIARQAADL